MLWAVVAVGLWTGAMGDVPTRVYEPNSYAQETYLRSTAPTRLFSSRVRRGKSWIGCLSEHAKCVALPGIECAATRLERVSMEGTTLDTLKSKIVPAEIWDAGWSESKSELLYPPVRCDDGIVRRSRIRVFGWLDPSRVLSAEFGSIMIDQAEQLDRRHYTFAQTRLSQHDPWIARRAESMKLGFPQLSLIVNPEDDEHWIAREFDPERGMRIERRDDGSARFEVILSAFRDNAENLPPGYNERLDDLKGTVYYDRLVLGKWARAEGSVFPMWNPAVHVVSAPASWDAWGGYPPPSWPRYRGIDFGYRNPFTCIWVAESPDGQRYVYRQYGRTETLVEDHARSICAVEDAELRMLQSRAQGDWREDAYLTDMAMSSSVADHDAEDAATLARHGVWTQPAKKDIHGCIQAICSHLNSGRLFVVAGSMREPDPKLSASRLPDCLERELSGARWQKLGDPKNARDDAKERPIDANNHFTDALGYILFSLEHRPRPMVIA